jgi:hypothetical protein
LHVLPPIFRSLPRHRDHSRKRSTKNRRADRLIHRIVESTLDRANVFALNVACLRLSQLLQIGQPSNYIAFLHEMATCV